MMPPRKPPKRLFKSRDVIHSYEHDRSTKLGMKKMTRDHIDVLHNIELALVSAAREDSTIDDRMVEQVLQAGIRQNDVSEDADNRIRWMWERLQAARATQDDVSDVVWVAGLRAVIESVRRHSTLTPGATGYLEFVGNYVR